MNFAYNPYMMLPLFAMLMALFLAYRGYDIVLRLWEDLFGADGSFGMVSFAVMMEHFSLALSAKIFWIQSLTLASRDAVLRG